MFRVTTAFLLLIISSLAFAQKEYPQNYFRSPVDIPILLSGNFAELRSNHFHSGIDIKTQGKIGLPVRASADGYISRISVSPYGFGHALYLDHPNGYTTVYGHLDHFNPKITQWIRKQQYQRESFAVNKFLKADQLPVKKGEIIAYSGNTGGSGGPHLHFEIRETYLQIPLNPLLFGFKVKDTVRPRLYRILVSSVENTPKEKVFSPINIACNFYGGQYHLKPNKVVKVAGKFGIAVHANDFLNDSWAKCGIYHTQLYLDDSLRYEFKLDKFTFLSSRYINSHIDFAFYKQKKLKIHKCYIDQGNKLKVYNRDIGNGHLVLPDDSIHKITVKMWDFAGNLSQINFEVQNGAATKMPSTESPIITMANHQQPLKHNSDNIEWSIPRGTLYRDMPFTFKEGVCSTTKMPSYKIMDEEIPAHKRYTLRIKLPDNDSLIAEKTLIAIENKRDDKLVALGGTNKNGWIETKVRQFGKFTLAMDTIAPLISSLSIKNNKQLIHKKSISFIIKDEFSGIKQYRGEIDGKWILLDYDAKRNRIKYVFDKERMQFNRHHNLKLVVEDRKGNKSFYNAKFFK